MEIDWHKVPKGTLVRVKKENTYGDGETGRLWFTTGVVTRSVQRPEFELVYCRSLATGKKYGWFNTSLELPEEEQTDA